MHSGLSPLCRQGLQPCLRRRRKRSECTVHCIQVDTFVPSDEGSQLDFICLRLLQCQIPPGRGGGHDEHQQNARKVDTACTHMRTELYVRMRDSFSQPAGGMWAPPPMRRRALARWEGGGELGFRGRVWVLFGVGLCCGGEGMLRRKCSGDGSDFDEWTPAMTLF